VPRALADRGHRGGGGGADRMTVDQRGDQSTVDEPWNGKVVRGRAKAGDTLAVGPLRTHVKSVVVQSPAAVAVGEIVRVEILDCAHAS
jgi:hypothetical protein